MFKFPPNFHKADEQSNATQKIYFRVLLLHFIILILTSLLFQYFNCINWVTAVTGVLSIATIVLYFLFLLQDFQGIWYSSRTVAESVKTVCWRFAMKAKPFDISDKDAENLLFETIKKIEDLSIKYKSNMPTADNNNDGWLESMQNVRKSYIDERRKLYLDCRINEQRKWYQKKSNFNKNKKIVSLWVLIGLSIVTTILLFASINNEKRNLFPVQPLLSLMSCFFTWIQSKRYSELQNSYAIAANDIDQFSGKINSVFSDSELSNFVEDAENAFSRENTRWIARRDNV